MVTAHDATMASIMDAAGIDVLLVGDSLGMVVLGDYGRLLHVGHDTPFTAGLSPPAQDWLPIVADMPFPQLTNTSVSADAISFDAGKLMQDGRAAAVKL